MSSHTDSLVQRSARLAADDIDFDAFAHHPLDPSTLRCLQYMCDVEGHTMCYLREVLATRAHRDPDLTAFLACWAYEEHWHGAVLSRVLELHGGQPGSSRALALRAGRARRDGLRLMLFTAGSAFTSHLVAIHMAWGAVNEWTTQAGYARLAARARHPQLTELLRRIMRQEGRHIDFYATQARARLQASATARTLTRAALQRFWAPVGSGVMPAEDVRFLAHHLFGGSEGLAAARRVDRQISRLPGLHGLQLLERAAT